MADKNITKVYLLSVPLENDYKNTLYFTSKEKQQQYFESKIIKSYTNFSYQRKDNFIRVPEHFDKLQNVNYVMYQNTAYSNKWFYAFVTDVKYIDDGRTDLIIEMDYIQTWLFDFTVKASFVEREHVSDDTVGKHTFPEALETGEYKCDLHETDTELDTLLKDVKYVMGSTSFPIPLEAKDSPAGSGIYNGIYSGVKYFEYEEASTLDSILGVYAESGKIDSITGIFMAPKFLAPSAPTTITGTDVSVTVRTVKESTAPYSYKIAKDKNLTTIDGYKPRNSKLFCYPYNYLYCSNNNGGSAIYEYELFSTDKCEFDVKGALTPGCSIRMTPKNYKGAVSNDEESLNLGKFPICNFVADMYTNWLTQNSINIAGHTITSDQINIAGTAVSSAMQTIAGIGMIASGAGALAGAGMIANGAIGGVSGISNALMQQKQHEMMPSQARGNLNCGDVITSDSKNTFHFYKMCIKKEYAQMLDGYMDMFGYKVNRVKVPNKAHRSRWWYTKTIDVNIDGAIPNKDMQVIKNCYNNGITFWRNADEIQNYALSNEISITDGAVTE